MSLCTQVQRAATSETVWQGLNVLIINLWMSFVTYWFSIQEEFLVEWKAARLFRN